MTLQDFLKVLFDENEWVCSGQAPDTAYFTQSTINTERDPYLCINPLKGTRKDENVTALRNILVELDELPLSEQHSFITSLGVPYSTRVYSGGKSYHYVVSLATPLASKAEYDALVARIYSVIPGIDQSNKNPSRFSRLPFHVRESSNKVQELLEVRQRVTREQVEAWLLSKGSMPTSVAAKPAKQLMALDSFVRKPPGKEVMNWVLCGIPEGKSWHHCFYRVAMDFKQQGWPQEETATRLEMMSKASGYDGELDETDLAQLDDIYNNRPTYPTRGISQNPFLNIDALPAQDVTIRNPKTGDFETRKDYPPSELVRFWITSLNAEYNYKNNSLILNRHGFVEALGFDKLIDDISQDLRGALLKVSREDIVSSLRIWFRYKRNEIFTAAVERIKFDPTTRDAGQLELTKFVDILTTTRPELDRLVLEHFIWQVKRKMLGREVVYHMMPIIYGPQGVGKSVTIKKFYSVINDFAQVLEDLSKLSDSRELGLLDKYYVLFVDEMVRADKAVAENLKVLLTGEGFSQRVMTTTEHITVGQNATLIGSSNKEILDLIKDSTGMRRFWQITTQKIDFERLATVDFNLIWKSVNENEDTPILPHVARLRQIQDEEFRSKDTVEMFFEEDCQHGDDFIRGQEVYNAYRNYCQERGYLYPVTRDNFYRALRSLGVKDRRKADGWGFYLTLSSLGPIKMM